jgi:hypothetical protein
MASGDSSQMVLWLVRNVRYQYSGSIASTNSISLTLTGFDPTNSYTIQFYDDTTGTLLQQATRSVSGGNLSFAFTDSDINLNFDKHMAILVKPTTW